MIISKEVNPERDFYYLGAKVIEILDKSEETNLNILELYNNMKKNNTEISFNVIILTLDWLYLIGAIDTNKGNIHKCF